MKRVLCFGGGSDIAQAIIGVVLVTHKDCDVRDLMTVEILIRELKPDAVINCAGISYIGLIKDQPQQLWLDQIDTNLVGSYNIARACAMYEVPVIFISSVAGLYGKAEHSAYCISKGGIITLVQSMAMEGHKAYAISPGRVDTKMREKDYPGEDKRTRLTTIQVANVVRDCINGKYKSGDNIIIRKKGYKTFIRVDRGEPWKSYLNVQPWGSPKLI